jgi:hypothetical protein
MTEEEKTEDKVLQELIISQKDEKLNEDESKEKSKLLN